MLDGEQLSTRLVFDRNMAITETNSQKLAVRTPVARGAWCRRLRLVDTLAVRHPEPVVNARAGSECLQDGVEAKGLDLVVVGVFEQPLAFR